MPGLAPAQQTLLQPCLAEVATEGLGLSVGGVAALLTLRVEVARTPAALPDLTSSLLTLQATPASREMSQLVDNLRLHTAGEKLEINNSV